MRALLFLVPLLGFAQTDFIEVKTYTVEQDAEVLKLYGDLRVADVSDGLDMAGLQDVGLMDPIIRPLWREVRALTRLGRNEPEALALMPQAWAQTMRSARLLHQPLAVADPVTENMQRSFGRNPRIQQPHNARGRVAGILV